MALIGLPFLKLMKNWSGLGSPRGYRSRSFLVLSSS